MTRTREIHVEIAFRGGGGGLCSKWEGQYDLEVRVIMFYRVVELLAEIRL